MARLLLSLLVSLWGLLLLVQPAPALAYDNPELLPDHPTPVIDLAKALTSSQRRALEEQLDQFEASSGWKLRVLTQYDRSPGQAVKQYWDLDERSLLLVADPRGGNLLNFNVGEALFALMPRSYWVELQTRYGNQYYVADHGEDGAIVGALGAVRGCLEQGGCQVVPGLPQEQWLLTVSTSVLGGLVAGFASYPRKQGVLIAWPWLLLMSPLWLILFGVLGLGPVLTRTADPLPVVGNVFAFLASGVAAYLLALWKLPKPEAKA